jgi:hypothetical protein
VYIYIWRSKEPVWKSERNYIYILRSLLEKTETGCIEMYKGFERKDHMGRNTST